ncbi:MAG: DNA mismatch repair protein MutS [Rickettsiales bacterium]|nr:DNA mismatch repair protein MutS [Rickettsiales bacterium]
MKQFLQIKLNHEEALLFYRMGDFYELFFEDAEDAAEILDIALTKRGKHGGEDIPMCGVPVHSHEMYLQKLIASGRTVAICEQLETPEEAKKRAGHKAVVHRDVVRIVTPGTITEDALLAPDRAHYLAAIAEAKGCWSIAWLDISTGAFYVSDSAPEQLMAEIARIEPKELLISDAILEDARCSGITQEYTDLLNIQPHSQFSLNKTEHSFKSFFGVFSLEGLGDYTASDIAACGALIEYVKLTQIDSLPRLDIPTKEQAANAMVIDAATRRNLELVSTLSGTRRGSLLSVIDRTKTSAGGRLIANWLMAPLCHLALIKERQAGIAWCLGHSSLHNSITECLSETPDIERALSRLCLGRGGPRDMQAIGKGLAQAVQIKSLIQNQQQDPDFAASVPASVNGWIEEFANHEALIDTLKAALADELPLMARDGGFIRKDYRADLDELRNLRDESKQIIATMQKRYADDTGISTLKIKFNNVLGYFIDVTASHESKVPEFFIHRQTLANNLRYTTTELNDVARKIHEAADKSLQLELQLFEELLERIKSQADEITKAARALANCDVICALAQLAESENYCCPQVDDSNVFNIKNGRHPVVEQAVRTQSERFIGNDCDLSENQKLWLLTGPNMAGKSTFLRQNALIAILAQMGSYVPADEAQIGIIDRLFSRVGAADDLARGRSTFMVEMVETATILNQSTPKSLVILDEIGRGTATHDGLSIAWAVVEYLHNSIQCRGLFATHYHELTALSEELAALSSYRMQVKEWKGEVVFLHQVAQGAADRSYGIHVAQLAGLPADVTNRAKHLLKTLESGNEAKILSETTDMLPLFQQSNSVADAEPSEIEEKIKESSVDDMTPKQALELLYELKSMLP